VGRGRIEVVQGDLTVERVDAIVNAANSALLHGGGVAGAVVRAGGDSIQRESKRLAPVPVGGAVVTGAGRLPCRFVVHAVGPVWGEGDEEAKLAAAVTAALDRAEELGLASIALPAISTGVFGFPKRAGCSIITAVVVARLRSPSGSLATVRLVSIDRETAEHFAVALTTFAER